MKCRRTFRVSLYVIMSLLWMCYFSITAESGEAAKNHAFSFGFQRSNFAASDIHMSKESANSELVFESVDANDDFRARNFAGKHFSELQYYLRYGYAIDTNDYLEVSLSHFTYIVDTNQTVRMRGTWNAAYTDRVVLLDNYIKEWEHSNGINQVIVGFSRDWPLLDLSPFSFGAKYRLGLGPSMINSNSEVVRAEGGIDKNNDEKNIYYGGLGGMQGFSLLFYCQDYFLELAAETHFFHLNDIRVVGGTASQDIAALSGVLQVGVKF